MKRVLLSIVGSLVFLLFPYQQVSAASAYDAAIDQVDELTVTYSNTERDLTDSYSGYITGYASDIHYSNCDFSNVRSIYSNMKNWFITQAMTNDKGVWMYFTTKSSPAPLEFSSSGNYKLLSTPSDMELDASDVLIYITAYNSTQVNVYCNTFNSNWNTGAVAMTYNDGSGNIYLNKPFSANYPINYPSNYEGEYIASVPLELELTTYNGSVDCGNDTIEYLLITQDGVTNPIPLISTSAYSADWSYPLTESPYVITAGCGYTSAASYSSVAPTPPTSNDWICDTMNDPHYCVLK